MIDHLYNATLQPVSYIKNSMFRGNKALSGGALHLESTHLIEVSGNTFEQNEAVSTSGHSDGGAILYTCDPTQISFDDCTVALLDNSFIGNKAVHKGGALRYENANFTDVRLIFDGSEQDSLPALGRRLQSPGNIF